MLALMTHFAIKSYEERLEERWVDAYEEGNDESARLIANKMGVINKSESAFYLAHVEVSDAIKAHREQKRQILSKALTDLEGVNFSGWPLLGSLRHSFSRRRCMRCWATKLELPAT